MGNSLFQTPPTYESIFGNTVSQTLKSVLPEQIPTFIKLTSYISSVLYLKHETIEEEASIRFFEDAIRGSKTGEMIVDWCLAHNVSHLEIINTHAFPFLYNILFELFEEGKDKRELSIEDKALYLKLLLVANSKFVDETKESENDNLIPFDDRLSFQKNIWPIILHQFEKRDIIDFTFELSRTIVMLSYAKEKLGYATAVDEFIEERGCSNIFEYAFSMADLLRAYFASRCKNEILCSYDLTPKMEKLLLPFTLSLPQTQKSQLTTHPILHLDDQLFVLDWNCLSGQIFLGTYFGLNSKIKKAGSIDKYGNTKLKGEIGNIMEEYLMKPIIETVFENNSQLMKYDSESGFTGYPDAMILSGSILYIFEFKDKLLSERVFKSTSYSVLFNDIDKGFVNDEGIKQLLDYMEKFVTNKYSSWFSGINSNVVKYIYPIIIYTDHMYGIEGINDYLVTRFEESISNWKNSDVLSNYYRNGIIQPVTIIGLDFFFKTAHLFNSNQQSLHILLDRYITSMRDLRIKMNNHTITDWDEIRNAYKSFESFHSNINYIHSSWDDMWLFLSHSNFEWLQQSKLHRNATLHEHIPD